MVNNINYLVSDISHNPNIICCCVFLMISVYSVFNQHVLESCLTVLNKLTHTNNIYVCVYLLA